MKIKAIIVDDEWNARKLLEGMLKEYADFLDVIGSCGSAMQGRELILEHNPDLVFLDIQMPNETGFEMLEKLGSWDFQLIFTTAYDQYALNAIKVSAMDYLLKPIGPEELDVAVQKAHTRFTATQDSIEMSSQSGAKKKIFKETILVPTSSGYIFSKVSEILRIESDNNYSVFFLADGRKIMVSKTLKYFDNALHGHSFFRVNQSNLINLRHVKEFSRNDGGTVAMSDGAVLSISRKKKKEFTALLHKLLS